MDLDSTLKNRHKMRKRLKRWTLRIGTWNVQGIRTKQEEIIEEVGKMNLDIVVFSETKKKGYGEETIQKFSHFWSGVPKDQWARSGVSILINNKWKKSITNVEYVDDRIIIMDLVIHGNHENPPRIEKD